MITSVPIPAANDCDFSINCAKSKAVVSIMISKKLTLNNDLERGSLPWPKFLNIHL